MLKTLTSLALAKSQSSYRNLIHIIHILPDITHHTEIASTFEKAKEAIESFEPAEKVYENVMNEMAGRYGVSMAVSILVFLLEMAGDGNMVSME
jgi:hypothetical protein